MTPGVGFGVTPPGHCLLSSANPCSIYLEVQYFCSLGYYLLVGMTLTFELKVKL